MNSISNYVMNNILAQITCSATKSSTSEIAYIPVITIKHCLKNLKPPGGMLDMETLLSDEVRQLF